MSDLVIAVAVVIVYLVITTVISIYGYRLTQRTLDDYFLADRAIGSFVMFFTLIATNFSAFFFLGFAGKSYQDGYSFYGVMSFGTAVVALSFYFIGHRSWVIGKKHGFITPPEMIGGVLQSNALKLVYLSVMVLFTIPYIAIQPIAAGHILHHITNGEVHYFLGSTLLTFFIVFYVFFGGMRTVAWTDVFQGIIMFICIITAVVIITSHPTLGGFTKANIQVYQQHPQLFSRSTYSWQLWFSFMVLFLLSVPMFPHMFMRFFICKDPKSLQISAILYPLVTAILFIFPVTIGVLGNLVFPGLTGKEVDTILPQMLTRLAPTWLAAVIMLGAVAAFMSTLDSQLLALSSILTRDVYLSFINRNASLRSQVIIGRVLVVILAVAGLAIAYKPPATIFGIAKQAFTGLAVLFPTTIACLYWKQTHAFSCLLSIMAGELLFLGFLLGWLPASWKLGFLPVIPVVITSTLIIVIGSLLLGKQAQNA